MAAVLPWLLQPRDQLWIGLGSIPHRGFTKKTHKEGAAKPVHGRKNVA